MKKIIILLTVMFHNFICSQQILQCGEDARPGIINESIYSHSQYRPTSTNTPYVLNVFFHIIRDSNGQNIADITECDVLNAVEMLNVTFSQFDIYFKYLGFDYIDNTDYLTIEYQSGSSTDDYHILQNNPQMRTDAMNIIVTENLTYNGRSAAGIAQRPGTYSVFDKDYLLTATLPHEIGHNLNLLHTHQGWDTQQCEHVNGDNCDSAGDMICDTPASYCFTVNNIRDNGQGDYEYINPTHDTDCMGVEYVDVPIRNFMSCNRMVLDNYYHNLRNEFTRGQGQRMRESINNNPSIYQPVSNTVASLYNPYKWDIEVDRNNDHIISISEIKNDPGYVMVCRPLVLAHYFTKGLNYEIYKINSSSTTQYYANGDVVDPSHATLKASFNPIIDNRCQIHYIGASLGVKIPEISDEIIVFQDLPGVRGTHCEREAITNTTIISTSNPGNPNIETTILDHEGSSNPHLIDDLQPNKYHYINQKTETNIELHKTIYKTNN